MNSRYDRDNDLRDLHDSGGPDREISLGTTTILGIFFALALLCAVFFAFGYSLGRHSVPATAAAAEAPSDGDSGGSKPAPGSPVNQGRSASAEDPQTPPDHSDASQTDSPSARDQGEAAPSPVRTVIAMPAPQTRAAAAVKAPAKPVAALPVVAPGPGSAVVQVAAVSHQEDADMLAAALKRRGYTVSVRQVMTDKLLHVQVGPFATKKDADAMRLRLQGDGYNAIVK